MFKFLWRILHLKQYIHSAEDINGTSNDLETQIKHDGRQEHW